MVRYTMFIDHGISIDVPCRNCPEDFKTYTVFGKYRSKFLYHMAIISLFGKSKTILKKKTTKLETHII